MLFLLEHPGLDAQQSGYLKMMRIRGRSVSLCELGRPLYTLRKAEKKGAFSRQPNHVSPLTD